MTADWQEQTLTLNTDPSQWTCLGGRWDLQEYYGCGPIDDVLADVNVDLIFVLFPVTVVPHEQLAEPHRTRPHLDYDIDWGALPSGRIEFDTVRIDY